MVQENEVMMKVAIYTIALNERQFVEKWYEAAKEADYLLIADTGSTDGTIEAAKKLARTYEQNAFVWCDEACTPQLIASFNQIQ